MQSKFITRANLVVVVSAVLLSGAAVWLASYSWPRNNEEPSPSLKSTIIQIKVTANDSLHQLQNKTSENLQPQQSSLQTTQPVEQSPTRPITETTNPQTSPRD